MTFDSAGRLSRRAPLAPGAAETGSGIFDSDFLEIREGFLRNTAVNTLRVKLRAGPNERASLHYASPRPLPEAEILRRGGG